jgi:quercetin dioxygenase-like cupin family protein
MDAKAEPSPRTGTTQDGAPFCVLCATMAVKGEPARLGLLLAELALPPGYVEPLHLHLEDDEILYLVEGELTLLLPEGERSLATGASVEFPRRTRHGLRNDTPHNVRLLVIARPGNAMLRLAQALSAAEGESQSFLHCPTSSRSPRGTAPSTDLLPTARLRPRPSASHAAERVSEKRQAGASRFSMRRIAAKSIIVSEDWTRYSQSLASRRFRLSHAMERSTTQVSPVMRNARLCRLTICRS